MQFFSGADAPKIFFGQRRLSCR